MKSLKERWKSESMQLAPKEDTKKNTEFEIFKTDEDQRLVFGWASVAVTVDGEELEDRQNDMIEPEELEEAAYEYVLNFRDTGEEHLPGYRKKGKLVESCVFTQEKQRAMGIPEGILPVAWWIGFKIEDDDAWQRVKNGTYKMFSIEGKAQREEVRKADSTARTFDEVLKFNPFHGWHGYFSSANDMKTYSANPKTKAGQLAIGRSAPNHGDVLNVHRESKGENIRQNNLWIKTGIKPPVAQEWDKTHHDGKPDKKVSTKEAKEAREALAEQVGDVELTSTMKLALQARSGGISNPKPTNTKQVAEDHYQERVEGKDISGTFDYQTMQTTKLPIDAMAEAQGWNKGATVTNDRELFDKACVKAGRVMVRTVGDTKTCTGTMTDGNMPLNGHGGKLLGSGLYVVDSSIKGKKNPAKEVAAAQGESYCYGTKQMMFTVHPNARIATPKQARKLEHEFHVMSKAYRKRFGDDVGAYIASKGYDGAKWHDDDDPAAYTTIYNKSALIFFGGVANY